jgi:hypothetical protein
MSMPHQYQFTITSYAGDGLCHSSQSGTFNHECGKPAVFIGTNGNAFRCGFCADCVERGIQTAGFRMERIISREVEDGYAYVTTA